MNEEINGNEKEKYEKLARKETWSTHIFQMQSLRFCIPIGRHLSVTADA
jgi:hypothetical protein